MARRRKVVPLEKPKPDLTPMIDIIFNLIIFFMIVADFSSLTVEDLALSYADQATPHEAAPTDRVIVVNVKEPGVAIVRGKKYAMTEAKGALYPSLRDLLELESAAIDDPGTEGSELEVTLRVDKDVPFDGAQKVLDACVDSDVFKTRFSATPQSPTE